jgi:long-chain acyl-CoA synthetase
MTWNLGDLFDKRARPQDVALIDCRASKAPSAYTFGQLDATADACARGLVGRGLGKGDRIAIMSLNRAEFIICWLGILRAGMVAVPVNYKLATDTIAHVFVDSAIRLAFCDVARRRRVPDGCPVVGFADDEASEFEAFLDPGAFRSVDVGDADEAAIFYTSGSTGRPKGVPATHRGQTWIIDTRLAAATGGGAQTTVVAAPFFHLNGLGSTMAMLANGGTTVLLPEFDAEKYVHVIMQYRATVITAVTTMLAMVIKDCERLVPSPIEHVRVVRVGSAPVTQALLAGIQAIFPNATVGNAYGVTEAGQIVFGPHPGGIPTPPISVGYPAQGAECRLLDERGGADDQGILWIRSPAVMTGYLNLAEKSREVLSADGWYRTNDIFRRDADGFYYFVGRADDMFVCGGENLYPSELEGLLERHPDVAQAVVVPVPDELKGEKPVAFVVRKAGRTVSESELKRFALEHGPAYQHPRMVTFLSALPWAGTNKIDRKALVRQALSLWEKRPPAKRPE